MIETTIRDPEKQETLRADSQGRVNLGIQYAGKTVEIVVAGSREEESDASSLQQTIGDRPMDEYERQGMLFIRLFGVDQAFLIDDHSATVDGEEVQPDTVGLGDVDWSQGYLLDQGNISRFEFDQDAEEQFAFRDELTAEPADVTLDESGYGEPVYCFENSDGETSAILEEYVEAIQQIFGYNPTEELSNVGVHPTEAPNPVIFRNPVNGSYIGVAPRIPE